MHSIPRRPFLSVLDSLSVDRSNQARHPVSKPKVRQRSQCKYLRINTLHKSIIRSLGRSEVNTPPTELEMFFLICSCVIRFSSITRPVRLRLYSLHSSTHFTITIHWIKNCSNDNKSGPGSVILFKQNSITGRSTHLSPNVKGCLPCIATKTFINLVHALPVKSQNLGYTFWKDESVKVKRKETKKLN